MQDIGTLINRLRRPRLLIQAARAGAEEYRREAHLNRLFGTGHSLRCPEILMRLYDMENELNHQRQTGDAGYSLPTHIDLLIAMMGEARIYRAMSSSVETGAEA